MGAVIAITGFRNTAHRLPDRFQPGRVQVVRLPPTAPFPPADRRRATAVLQRFVRSAVARHRPADSYDLVTRHLRGDLTRRQWATGDIPVYPYPADPHRKVEIAWLRGSYANAVTFDVVLAPRPDADVGLVSAAVDMRALGRGRRRHWLVDAFLPQQFYPRSATESDVRRDQARRHPH